MSDEVRRSNRLREKKEYDTYKVKNGVNSGKKIKGKRHEIRQDIKKEKTVPESRSKSKASEIVSVSDSSRAGASGTKLAETEASEVEKIIVPNNQPNNQPHNQPNNQSNNQSEVPDTMTQEELHNFIQRADFFTQLMYCVKIRFKNTPQVEYKEIHLKFPTWFYMLTEESQNLLRTRIYKIVEENYDNFVKQ